MQKNNKENLTLINSSLEDESLKYIKMSTINRLYIYFNNRINNKNIIYQKINVYKERECLFFEFINGFHLYKIDLLKSSGIFFNNELKFSFYKSNNKDELFSTTKNKFLTDPLTKLEITDFEKIVLSGKEIGS
jgi:hypothetical protein